ncbi:hypothetical protein P5673_027916 [Acropora cervicornis]|uniref:Uncharacterized protein n=1 Tax=Acropora cervicornis TaxID=6130 RepID=A0AAD9PY64_ACRCE|nr:hypothetical protein P5673_027916 [Acropora cervicornis]
MRVYGTDTVNQLKFSSIASASEPIAEVRFKPVLTSRKLGVVERGPPQSKASVSRKRAFDEDTSHLDTFTQLKTRLRVQVID